MTAITPEGQLRGRFRFRWLRPDWRTPLAVTGAVLAIGWALVAVFAPLLAPYDPLAQDFQPFPSPSRDHLFGTDELGRDVFSRTLYGARISLPLGILLVVARVHDRRHPRRDRRLQTRLGRRRRDAHRPISSSRSRPSCSRWW